MIRCSPPRGPRPAECYCALPVVRHGVQRPADLAVGRAGPVHRCPVAREVGGGVGAGEAGDPCNTIHRILTTTRELAAWTVNLLHVVTHCAGSPRPCKPLRSLQSGLRWRAWCSAGLPSLCRSLVTSRRSSRGGSVASSQSERHGTTAWEPGALHCRNCLYTDHCTVYSGHYIVFKLQNQYLY